MFYEKKYEIMIDEPQPRPDKKESLSYGCVWGVIYICVCVCGGQEKYMRGGCTGDKRKEASRTARRNGYLFLFVCLFVCATKTGQSKRALNRGERGTQTLYKTRESSGIHMYY